MTREITNSPDLNLSKYIFQYIKLLEQLGEIDKALDEIFDLMDEMMLEGNFELIDSLLRDIKIEDFSITVLLCFITVTFPARSELKERKGLYDRIIGTEWNFEEFEEKLDKLFCGLV